MKLLKIGLFFCLGLLLGGCEQSQNPAESEAAGVASVDLGLNKIALPAGASLTSAKLFVYQFGALKSNTVHRIIKDWDESTVTWSNFGGQNDPLDLSYDPVAVATFTPTGGWQTIDITSLVQDWLNGTYPDHGVLLKQVQDVPPGELALTYFFSSEATGDHQAHRPYLELKYDVAGGPPQTVVVCRGILGSVWDAYIFDGYNDPYGGSIYLMTGFWAGREKLSLIKFDLDFGSSCTRTIGYWKTHGPTPTGNNSNEWLPVTSMKLGEVTYTDAQLLRILNSPVKGNGLISLAHQLIGAKLNVAHGTDDAAVSAAIVNADALIGALVVPPIGAGYLAPSVTSGLVKTLTDYNEGTIGPGQCDD